MEDKQIRHLAYCSQCDKNMRDTTISMFRAWELVEGRANLFDRYVLMPNRKTGEGELLEESCCDSCYRELQARERQMRMEQEIEDSLAAHEKQLEEYFQNDRWQ